jgi:CRISPR/Cas system-associated exonuclease Cas4 (RecB family)
MPNPTHPAELLVHQYMTDALNGKTTMPDDVIEQVGKDVTDALKKQFGSGETRKDFKLRMSNLGRPTCQLWFEKNKPELATGKPNNFMMNMMLGDIVEAVFKGLLKASGVKYEEPENVELEVSDTKINGTYDLVIDDAVDDVKSASSWSYDNKFESFETLSEGDAFGYIAQLVGYAQASNKKVGVWWVVNKANGKFKYVSAKNVDIPKEMKKIEATVKKVNENKFERCFEPVEETFRGKPTGNKVLGTNCSFCDYKHSCWETLQELPSVMSKAQFPKVVSYVELRKEYVNEQVT